jgi:hypothetical protein
VLQSHALRRSRAAVHRDSRNRRHSRRCAAAFGARASRAGQVQRWRLARELALAPGEIASLLRLARRYRAAKRTLRSLRVQDWWPQSASSAQVA